MAVAGPAQQSAQRQAAFQALRPVTTRLLQLRTQPVQLHAQLRELQALLEGLPPEGLAGCWDYVMLPLSMLLDSVVPSRQGPPAGATAGGGNGTSAAAPLAEAMVPACQSDRVAEALLGEWGSAQGF